jgi:hypothetical protein
VLKEPQQMSGPLPEATLYTGEARNVNTDTLIMLNICISSGGVWPVIDAIHLRLSVVHEPNH